MKVEQIATLCNTIGGEVLGKTEVVKADLSNVVDFGNEVIGTTNLDNYVKALIDHIGKMAFVDRPYNGSAPSVLMDGWEFGSILEKVTMTKLPEAQDNSSWNLVNGQSYDTGVFTAPQVSAKFYNSMSTYEIPMSFAEKQVKSGFSSAQQMNAFFSMIQTSIETSMAVKTDGLIMDTINTMIAETLVNYNAEGVYTGVGNSRAVNLLALYNARFGTTLTPEKCLTDGAFIRWASFMIGLYSGRMTKLSTLFNIGGQERFTAKDKLHLVMLDEFSKASDVYLQSDTYHEKYTALPNAETVPFWMGSGTAYNFASTSSINIKHGTHEVAADGILAVMFDREALGVSNLDRRVTSQYNARGEFYNNWYKFDAGYFNDLNENFVVFYVA